jgi:hypothetical protein
VNNYVIHHDTSSKHSLLLTKEMQTVDCSLAMYENACINLPENFLNLLTKKNQEFLPGVFENFEEWALLLEKSGYKKNFESITRFIIEGIVREAYLPRVEAITIIKSLIPKDEELAYSAIELALASLIDQDKLELSFVKETIGMLSSNSQPISLWVLDYIIDAYVSGELKSVRLIINILESNLQAPASAWIRLLKPSLELLKEAKTKEERSKIILLLDRLNSYHVNLPDEAIKAVEERRALFPNEPLFVTHYTREEVLEEFIKQNTESENIKELGDFFREQLEKITERNAKSNYQLRLSYEKEPGFIRRGALYVYMKGAEILCQTRNAQGEVLKFALQSLDKGEEESLRSLLTLNKPIHPYDIRTIEKESGYLMEWSKEDFLNWRDAIVDVTDENIAEVISVL